MPISKLSGFAPPRGTGQWTSVPYGWDTGYKTAQRALASSGTPIRVEFHGHSIMAGYKGTSNLPAPSGTGVLLTTDAFRWIVRNFLVAKFGRSADYFGVTLSQHGSDFGGAGTSTYTWTDSPPWLLQTAVLQGAPLGFMNGTARVGYVNGVATLEALAYSGMGGDGIWFNPGAGQTIATFQHSAATWLETCRAYDLVAPNYTAGTPMSYNVNGAGANNVTLTADGRIQVIQMATGLTAGRYDTVIKGVGASGQPWLSGVTAHATTRGAPGVQCAHIGVNAGVLSNMDLNYLTLTCEGVDATSGVVGAGGFPMGSDLVICDCLLSDTGLFSPDVSTQRFAQWIEAKRRSKANASFIFVIDYRANGVTTDGSAADGYTLGYPTHVEALLAVAQQQNCAVVNIHDAWQGKGVALGYSVSGNNHPTAPGHAAIAAAINALL